jgi:hypothetical protein
MAYGTGSSLRQGLWSDLSLTLLRLEAIASRPADELGAEAASELSRLQYSLHRLAERLVGVRPSAGFVAAHAELTDALVAARDATAELAEAAELDGAAGAAPLVYEWRGALFRLRLARMMLRPPPTREEPTRAPEPDLRAALTAFGLTVSGGAAFVGGALIAAWPLWTAGMIAVVAGLLVYRP